MLLPNVTVTARLLALNGFFLCDVLPLLKLLKTSLRVKESPETKHPGVHTIFITTKME